MLTSLRKKSNLFVRFIVYCIKKVWHGKFGRQYNKRKNILCRFYPSCSNYAIGSLEKYGLIKGAIKSYSRLRRCTNKNLDSTIDFP